jgi:hypothetical protein
LSDSIKIPRGAHYGLGTHLSGFNTVGFRKNPGCCGCAAQMCGASRTLRQYRHLVFLKAVPYPGCAGNETEEEKGMNGDANDFLLQPEISGAAAKKKRRAAGKSETYRTSKRQSRRSAT